MKKARFLHDFWLLTRFGEYESILDYLRLLLNRRALLNGAQKPFMYTVVLRGW
jgi:hypothetical protein